MNADHPSGRRAGAGPVAPRHLPFAVFAVPLPAARGRSTEGQNGASRGGLSLAASASAVVQSHRGEWPTWGQAVASRRRLQGVGAFREIAQRPSQRKDGHRSRRTWICEIAQQPSRRGPVRAGGDPGKEGHRSRRTRICEIAQRPSRWVRHGPGHDRGKDGHRSRRTWFLQNCATTLPPGSARAGPRPRGRINTSRGGRGFCEIPQRPSRRVRYGRGAIRGRRGTGRGGRGFCEMRNNPLAGFGTAGFSRNRATTPGSSARGQALGSGARGHGAGNNVRPGGPAAEGAVPRIKGPEARLFRPRLDAGVGRHRAVGCGRHSLVRQFHETAVSSGSVHESASRSRIHRDRSRSLEAPY